MSIFFVSGSPVEQEGKISSGFSQREKNITASQQTAQTGIRIGSINCTNESLTNSPVLCYDVGVTTRGLGPKALQ
jgi:hypothetical protein